MRSVLTGVAVIAALACPAAGTRPADSGLRAQRRAVLCLVNGERRRHRLPPVHEDRALDHTAQKHDEEMVELDYASHVGADGTDPTTRIGRGGYVGHYARYLTGEDIGFGSDGSDTPAAIVAAWMGSPEHRSIVLDRHFHDAGVGVVAQLPPAVGLGADGAIFTLDLGLRRR